MAYKAVKLASGGIEYPSNPFKGVSTLPDPKYVRSGTLLLEQNFVPYQTGVAAKRKGTTYLNTSVWTSVTAVRWAIRFYVSSSVRKKIVCVNKAAGDDIGQVNDTTGAFTSLTGLPALTANKRWRGAVAGETPALYLGNDTDALLKSADGVSAAVLAGTMIPSKGYMGGPFFDRLLCWTAKRVYYSQTNLYTNWANPTTGNAMYLLVNHPEDVSAVFTPGPDRTEVGFLGKLYVCTPTSTWAQYQDFDQSTGSPSSTFTKIHERAGVASFNTLDWTDRGAIAMGVDNVWFFPINGQPVPIGDDIKDTIKAVPAAYRTSCCGVYWQGFYILSYVRNGQTAPDREYWADMRGYNASAVGLGITWHGPMIRGDFGILCFMAQTQNPDENELFGFKATEGRCMALEQDIYTDGTQQMTSILQTADLGGESHRRKVIHGYSLGTYVSDNDTVTIRYDMDEGRVAAEKSLVLTSAGPRYDTAVWDTAVWGGAMYDLAYGHWDPRAAGQKVRLTVTHTTPQAFAIKDLGAIMQLHGRMR